MQYPKKLKLNFIEWALAKGATYEQIGDILGVTKHAIRKFWYCHKETPVRPKRISAGELKAKWQQLKTEEFSD